MLTLENAFGLSGRVALITGGGSGLGFSMAQCLAGAGATVVIVGRREIVLNNACDKIGGSCFALPFDISNTSRLKELVNTVIDRHGKIDILINNAGNQIKKDTLELTADEFSVQLNLHLGASFSLTQTVLPHMLEREQGSVIFLSSMSGFIGLTKITGYAAAKSGVMGLVRSFAGEFSHTGVRFNAIVPGFIDSPMFQKAISGDAERRQKILSRTPMARFGEPEDIGWAAVYLASDASRFVTGTSLAVDGGAMTGF